MNSISHAAVFAAFSGLLMLGAAPLAAQAADHQAAIEEAHRNYEQAIADRDYQALAAGYAENAVHLPPEGGILVGREEIRQYFEQDLFTSVEVRGQRVDPVGENLVIDFGTATVGLSEELGGGEMEVEYLSVAEVGANGSLIHYLVAFPPRQTPDAAAQQ